MAKRFINTDIWDKGWFADLSPKMKIVWVYLFTKCDHAGVFEPNLKLMSFLVGGKITMDEIRQHLGDHIVPIDGSSKWLIKDFIPFQYGNLNPNVKAHNSVIKILNKYDLDETLIEGFDKGLITLMDKDIDKDKDLNKNKELVKDQVKATKRYSSVKDVDAEVLAELFDSKEFSRKDVYGEFEKFKDYLSAKGRTYKNYLSAFKNWLRSDWEKDMPIEETGKSYDAEQLKKFGIKDIL